MSPDEALPGRGEEMPVPERHVVLGTPLVPPFPEGRLALFGMGCFWGAERDVLADPRRRTRPRSATRAAPRPNPTYGRSARAAPATPRPCGSCSTRRRMRYEELLRVFWESHDPTQGMRQGNDVGTQYRSAIYTYGDEQRDARPRPRATRTRKALAAAGHGADHDRDRRGRRVLPRRGLPPAVPREEPGRLLRAGRHGS